MFIRYLSLTKKNVWVIILVIALLVERCEFKRGGSIGRGSSGRSGGGIFGSRKSNTGNSGGTFNHGGGGYSNMGSSGSGGFFGSKQSSKNNNNYGNNNNKWDKKHKHVGHSQFTKGNGVGSVLRSNTFKNAIVGAAAGYLTYQAGKAIINNVVRPMMWNNRPYYWGSNHYPANSNMKMCRMPIQSGDSQFGNVYFSDNTRPREITWGCSFREHCCGYECCPGNDGYGGGYSSGYYNGGNRFGQFGLGSLIVLMLLCCGGGFLIYQVCQSRQNSNGNWFSRNKYMPGRSSNEPPPQYTM